MSQFPIILIPTKIERIQQELPPIPTFTDRPPAYPRLEPQPPTFVRTLIEAVIFSICASLIYPISKIAGIILFIIGLGILSIYQFQRVKKYRKQLHSYNLVLEAYYKSLDIYARKEAQHETRVVLAHSSTKLLEYRRPKLLEFLGGAITHGSIASNIPQREVARDFAQVLSQYFPNLIHVGWQIERSNQIFKLDIAYIDPDTNLHIAIEVDETHNRNVKGTKEYHQNLMDAGWIVMRFSESQVTQSPQSCGKAIALLLDQLWGLPQLMHRFADVHDLVTVSDRDRQHIS
jgi:very-short-patch-repair endonuclease